jgi:hypothetical protein
MFLLLGVAVIGCTEISYKEPQPKGIKSLLEVPSKLHGTYLWQGDTITFFNKGFRAKDKKEDFLYLSDSIVLKKYKGYYFVSYRDQHEWLVRVLKPESNGDLSYFEMENVPENAEEKKVFLEKLSKETPVVETTVDSVTHYVIDPSPKKLQILIAKGFFKEKNKLVKIK